MEKIDMVKRFLIITAMAALMSACCPGVDYAAFVDQKIGTGEHGHVFVGANVPYGMVQLGPTGMPQAWDWCSGYHDSDSTLIGFSHTHLSGTGIGDLFDVTILPVTGRVEYRRGLPSADDGAITYALRSDEVAEPGYYSVPLSRGAELAEMTATCRVGLHRYTFPECKDAAIIVDLENGGCWDDVTDAGIEALRDADGKIIALSGWRFSTGWAKNQRVFFCLVPEVPADGFTVYRNPDNDSSRGIERMPVYGRLSYDSLAGPLQLKVAISPVSCEGAFANMEKEMPGWDFDAVKAAARKAWNKELSKVELDPETEPVDMKIFYTSLFHTMTAPSVFNDVDGRYRGCDDAVRENGGFTNYTTFSLWDTYRAAQPLMTILHPEMMGDIVNTMLHICDEQGKLPVWHLWGNETDCMVGNPGAIVVADAIVKGFGGFDTGAALDALKKSLMLDERGQGLRRQYGYIPCDLYNESVGNDMEYAIADGAAANAAAVLGDSEAEACFRERSHSYRNFFDPQTGFMRARLSTGEFRTPFNPFFSNHSMQDYTEGTAWQYIWLVPQDVDGLVECFGSREKALEKLDSLFLVSSDIAGSNASPDISGMIGQYAHGNEPGHHTVYLYSMLGQPWKAAQMLRRVYDEMYSDDVAGLAGNEDVGQMSAWYVLSSLGFYQVEPASERFWFGAPVFRQATVRTSGGKLLIKAVNLSSENPYIQSVRLNGRELDRGYILFGEIVAGGCLEFTMGSEPVSWYECKE